MAIEYNDVQVAKDGLQEQLSALQELITIGRAGKAQAKIVTNPPFTAAQKAELLTRASVIKTEIATYAADLALLLP
ncbi:MAG: hypothetical protein V3U75_01240 [Methylococcaceae bacterium]